MFRTILFVLLLISVPACLAQGGGMDYTPDGSQFAVSGYEAAGVGNRVELPVPTINLNNYRLQAGDYADLLSTGVAIGTGWAEANPLMTLAGNSVPAVLISGYILKKGMRYVLVKGAGLSKCRANRVLSNYGAAAAGWNVALMAGAASGVGAVVALVGVLINDSVMKKHLGQCK